MTKYQNQSKQSWSNTTILWNHQVKNDRTFPNNKADILICDNETGTRVLINVAISGDRNMFKREAEKMRKYDFLIVEIQSMWNLKGKLIPVITGATGTTSTQSRQYLSNKPRRHKIKELQKKKPRIEYSTLTVGNTIVSVQKTYFTICPI